MPNPCPIPYTKANHKSDCPCPACIGKRGEGRITKAFRFRKETLSLLAGESEKTGKSQNKIAEEALNLYLKEGDNP